MQFLLSRVPGIHEVLAIDTKSLSEAPWQIPRWKGAWDLVRTLRARRYDLSLDFQGLLKTALLGLLGGARIRIGFCKSLVWERPAHWFYHRRVEGPAEQRHVVFLNLLLAAEAGASARQPVADLVANEEDERTVRGLLDREGLTQFVVVNPGGGWPTKRWSPARYAALAERINSELRLPVVVTTGPGEGQLYAAMSEACRVHLIHLPLPFLQLIPLLKQARLFVGGDTGPFHLACALGTPVVGILGPTSPRRNGPWSERDEAVFRVLPCSFCYGRTCPTENECMDISVEAVFEAVSRRVKSSH